MLTTSERSHSAGLRSKISMARALATQQGLCVKTSRVTEVLTPISFNYRNRIHLFMNHLTSQAQCESLRYSDQQDVDSSPPSPRRVLYTEPCNCGLFFHGLSAVPFKLPTQGIAKPDNLMLCVLPSHQNFCSFF